MRHPRGFLEIVSEQLLLEHLGKADDGIEGGAQLVGHVGQELRLVAIGRLQLQIQPSQLVVHVVEILGQRPQFVPVRDIDVPREVSRSDLAEPHLHLPDRHHQ